MSYCFSNKSKFNFKKLLFVTQKWSGLKNLDLAKQVTTKKNYLWKDFKQQPIAVEYNVNYYNLEK